MEKIIKLSQSEINQIVIQHLVDKDIAPPKIRHTLLWNVINISGISKVELAVTIKDH